MIKWTAGMIGWHAGYKVRVIKAPYRIPGGYAVDLKIITVGQHLTGYTYTTALSQFEADTRKEWNRQ